MSEETCSITADEFAVLDKDGELLAFEVVDADAGIIDVVMSGRRQAISRTSIDALLQALVNFLNTSTFDQEG